MAPTTFLKVVLLLFVCVEHALCQQSAQCENVMTAARNYIDYLKGQRNVYQETVRNVALYLGFNMGSEAEIEQLLCSIVDAQPKTISTLNNDLHLDDKHLAFVYTALLTYLRHQLKTQSSDVNHHGDVSEFYEVTGFPTFPLKMNQRELLQYLRGVDKDTVARLFPYYADYIGEEPHIFYTPLAHGLTDATSLEDFARHAYLFQSRDLHSSFQDEAIVQSEVDLIVQQLLSAPQQQFYAAHESVKKSPEYAFLDALEKSGFMDLRRGNPELYSCDFIADSAVKALRYVQQILSRDMVTMMLHQAGFAPDIEAHLQSLVCDVMRVKSKQELEAVVPQMFVASLGVTFDAAYPGASLYAYLLLVRPGFAMSAGMPMLRVLAAVESAGFPTFPLTINTEQAKQMAVFVDKMIPINVNVEDMAQQIQDADSIDDIIPNPFMAQIVGKTDIVVQLASCVYQMLMSAEEQGLFMLPDN